MSPADAAAEQQKLRVLKELLPLSLAIETGVSALLRKILDSEAKKFIGIDVEVVAGRRFLLHDVDLLRGSFQC